MKEVSIAKILEIVNFNIENVEVTSDQLDENLADIGMDSITFIRIIVSLEEEFECEIPDSKLLLTEMNTVNKMLEVLKSIDTKPTT